ncbi:MAG: orotidine-5'-phosphate decarboxylase, partial [Dehalococcoidia bacterium]|nr:orotidine-5'-phosphate decarboxylase [Dehalococcoidia bacterium]
HRAIIEATSDIACAYKPNFAFFEAMGAAGYEALAQTLEAIPRDIPVIADAKRGDVPNTAMAYARAIYDVWNCDAVTVNPYLGHDSIEPFLRPGRGVFLLCRTSNPGAGDLQDLRTGDDGAPLYQVIARRAAEWGNDGSIGLVVGATYPDEGRAIRKLAPGLLFLVPGLGAQGGDLEASVAATLDRSGQGCLFNASRQVIYAGAGKDFDVAARAAALALRDAINGVRDAQVVRRQVKAPMDLRPADRVQLKKAHACGGDQWTVTRIGADIGLRCERCERHVLLDRVTVERRIVAFIERAPSAATG